MKKTKWNNSVWKSPIGYLNIVGAGDAIYEIQFREKGLDANPSSITQKAQIQLQEYFEGKRTIFQLPLAPQGTTFQQKTWKALQTIPFGTTDSYLHLARKVGNKKAVRAVGSANGKNPIPIVIPCHRIIGSNGELTGYSGGLWRKEKLLTLEGSLSQKNLKFSV